jgi:hypothetical protein
MANYNSEKSFDFGLLLQDGTWAYDEGLLFFQGRGTMNNVLKKIAADLDRCAIQYAVIGAIALNMYGYRRFTEDIDLLMTREDLQKFQDKLIGLGYRPKFQGATRQFRTVQENIPIEIITAGEYPGDGLPKPVQFPNPLDFITEIEGIKVLCLEKLVELKLASGLTAPHRLKDLADVQELIQIKHLLLEFSEKLDSSVRDKFIELYNSVQPINENRDR